MYGTDDSDFLDGWDWERISRYWSRRLADFSVNLGNIFQDVSLFDAANPQGREPPLSWWPVGEISQLHLQAQHHLDQWPGTRDEVHPPSYYTRQGEIDTLDYLWSCKGNPSLLCALLMHASLFSRLHSRRGHYPSKYWPSRKAVSALDDLAKAQLVSGDGLDFHGWHPSCTTVIPVRNEDFAYKVEDALGLIRYLAEEHASLLLTERPVRLIYTDTKDPFVANRLEADRKETQARLEEMRAEQERRDQEEADIQRQLKRRHPRYGQFPEISSRELTELVWTKPTKDIADEFGVSDSAVGKRCKRDGIKKPPRGFWNQVKSGQRPHPNGMPVSD